jgi:hypothetical protein
MTPMEMVQLTERSRARPARQINSELKRASAEAAALAELLARELAEQQLVSGPAQQMKETEQLRSPARASKNYRRIGVGPGKTKPANA